MRVHEIITESKKIDELSLDQVGRGVGKVTRGVAKGVGAVAGGLVGAGKAFMKGFRGAKSFVGGDAPKANTGDYGQISKDGQRIWNKQIKQWEPYDASAGSTTGAAAQSAAPGAAPAGAPGTAPSTGAQAAPAAGSTAPAPGGTAPAMGAKTAPGKTDMKTIKASVKALPKNQRASLRKIVAAKAGVA